MATHIHTHNHIRQVVQSNHESFLNDASEVTSTANTNKKRKTNIKLRKNGPLIKKTVHRCSSFRSHFPLGGLLTYHSTVWSRLSNKPKHGAMKSTDRNQFRRVKVEESSLGTSENLRSVLNERTYKNNRVDQLPTLWIVFVKSKIFISLSLSVYRISIDS